MNRYAISSRRQRVVFAAVALLTSLITFGSIGGLAQHYADAAVPAAQELVMAAPPAQLR